MVEDICANMMMVLIMRIEVARSLAKIAILLHKLRVIDHAKCDYLIDMLTVKVLQADLNKEKEV